MINIFQSTTATKFLFNLVEKKYTFEEQVLNQGERALSLNYLHKGKMEFSVFCGNQKVVIYKSDVHMYLISAIKLVFGALLVFCKKAMAVLYNKQRRIDSLFY